jgi:hypothetical protein
VAVIANVEVELQLRMDEDHLWIVNVTFIKRGCRLEVQ